MECGIVFWFITVFSSSVGDSFRFRLSLCLYFITFHKHRIDDNIRSAQCKRKRRKKNCVICPCLEPIHEWKRRKWSAVCRDTHWKRERKEKEYECVVIVICNHRIQNIWMDFKWPHGEMWKFVSIFRILTRYSSFSFHVSCAQLVSHYTCMNAFVARVCNLRRIIVAVAVVVVTDKSDVSFLFFLDGAIERARGRQWQNQIEHDTIFHDFSLGLKFSSVVSKERKFLALFTQIWNATAWTNVTRVCSAHFHFLIFSFFLYFEIVWNKI